MYADIAAFGTVVLRNNEESRIEKGNNDEGVCYTSEYISYFEKMKSSAVIITRIISKRRCFHFGQPTAYAMVCTYY
jgi:hypothetical protein